MGTNCISCCTNETKINCDFTLEPSEKNSRIYKENKEDQENFVTVEQNPENPNENCIETEEPEAEPEEIPTNRKKEETDFEKFASDYCLEEEKFKPIFQAPAEEIHEVQVVLTNTENLLTEDTIKSPEDSIRKARKKSKAKTKKKSDIVNEMIKEKVLRNIQEVPETKTLNLYPKLKKLNELGKYKLEDKPKVVFLVYAPGTNRDEIIYPALRKFGFEKLSIGKLLHEEGRKHDVHGEEIHHCLENKLDVPGDVVVNIIDHKIQLMKHYCSRFLVCGFPRSEDNSDSWKRIIKAKYEVVSLVNISYTRKEYETELHEREKNFGEKLLMKEMMKKFDYFVRTTTKVFDDFGLKRLISLSAKIPDKLIIDKIVNHSIFISNFPVDNEDKGENGV